MVRLEKSNISRAWSGVPPGNMKIPTADPSLRSGGQPFGDRETYFKGRYDLITDH
jgi:hypothetical protein